MEEEYCHLSNIRQEARSFRRRLTENPFGINEIGFRQEGREGKEELNHASERLFSLGSALRADLTAVNLTAGSVLP